MLPSSAKEGDISARKRVLLVAFHYPPCRGSSGLQRTLSFSRYLPALGWMPVVVSADPRAYSTTGNDQMMDIPSSVIVRRAFALDTAKHLSFRGRYLSWMALPDQWVSWLFWAVPTALQLIREQKPSVIWSTYPISTAHLIGYFLHRLTGLPWVADFRDPMTEIDSVMKKRFPEDIKLFRVRSWIERLAVRHCARAVVVTNGALKLYRLRYPKIPSERWALIPNGYDEEMFTSVSVSEPTSVVPQKQQITLLHSGVLYPTPDRDPRPFFRAVARLKKDGDVSARTLKIILRASGSEHLYREAAIAHGIEDLVSLDPPISYRAALSEMLGVDGLLIFQGYDSNPAVPAKLYEYIRARRPIFAMVDSQGDTAAILREAGVGTIVPLDSEERIAAGLTTFLERIRNGTEPVAKDKHITLHSRESHTKELAALFDSVAAGS